MRAGVFAGLVGLTIVLVGCREKPAAPPRAVAVRADGALELVLATFNVRREGDDDRGWRAWGNRIGRVVGTVARMEPDVFGIQEARHGQVADLRASLPDFGFHGIGRDDGGREGEYAGIFWRADRFEADEGDRGTFWLSPTPEMAGSMGWGNEIPRVAAWVRLVDRASGRGFYVFNTHLDHRSQASRERAALLLAERIGSRKRPDEPVALLGDFNAVPGNPLLGYLQGERVTLAGEVRKPWAGGLRDAVAGTRPELHRQGTLHLWRGDDGPPWRVDHILVSEGAELLEAEVVKPERGERLPSDHHPVRVRLRWSVDGLP